MRMKTNYNYTYYLYNIYFFTFEFIPSIKIAADLKMNLALVMKVGSYNIIIKPRLSHGKTRKPINKENSKTTSVTQSEDEKNALIIQIHALNFINRKRCRQRDNAASIIQKYFLSYIFRKFVCLYHIFLRRIDNKKMMH